MMRVARDHSSLHKRPGSAAGIEYDQIVTLSSKAEQARITCIDYSPEFVLVQEISDANDFLNQHRPERSAVRWINVDGLSDMRVISAMARKYQLHPLAIEDLLDTNQRPKVEAYGGQDCEMQARLFIIARMVQMEENNPYTEQISIFLGHNTVLTFQERRGDVWDGIRQRLNTRGSRLRDNGASFLVYSLLDSMVGYCFPVLEYCGERLEELEDLVLEQSLRNTIGEIHRIKRNLLLIRRAIWPIREVISALQREPHECMSEVTRVYLRDVYDQVVQIIDILETYREMATGLTETYMSATSNRMNEIVKVLTIIGTIFIPLTFLAGVEGMNFEYMPELRIWWAYPFFWFVCVLLTGTMLLLFGRLRWL